MGRLRKHVSALSAIVDGEDKKSQDERIIQELVGNRKSARKQSIGVKGFDEKPGKLDDNVMKKTCSSTSTGAIIVDMFGRD